MDEDRICSRSHGRDPRGRLSRLGIYDRLQEGLEHLQRVPSPIEAEDIWGDIWYVEAHNSTAIEGNTLILKEVEILLRDGRAVGNKQLADYLEVRGYADAAQWVYSHALDPRWTGGPLITLSEVRHVHQLIMTPVWVVQPHPHALPEERPGNFRRHGIAPFPGGMTPPAWVDVDAALHDSPDDLTDEGRRSQRRSCLAAGRILLGVARDVPQGRACGAAGAASR